MHRAIIDVAEEENGQEQERKAGEARKETREEGGSVRETERREAGGSDAINWERKYNKVIICNIKYYILLLVIIYLCWR